MYDAFKERYQEAIQNSLIFKDANGKTDFAIVNSMIELIKIRVYMPHEFIVKAGSYDECLYFILDGEAVMFSLSNELLSIMRTGSHFNVDIG